MFIEPVVNTLPAYLYLTLAMLALAAGLYVAGKIVERRQENRLLASILDALGYGHYLELVPNVRLAYEMAMFEAAEDGAELAALPAPTPSATLYDRETLVPVSLLIGGQWVPIGSVPIGQPTVVGERPRA